MKAPGAWHPPIAFFASDATPASHRMKDALDHARDELACQVGELAGELDRARRCLRREVEHLEASWTDGQAWPLADLDQLVTDLDCPRNGLLAAADRALAAYGAARGPDDVRQTLDRVRHEARHCRRILDDLVRRCRAGLVN